MACDRMGDVEIRTTNHRVWAPLRRVLTQLTATTNEPISDATAAMKSRAGRPKKQTRAKRAPMNAVVVAVRNPELANAAHANIDFLTKIFRIESSANWRTGL